MDQWKSTYVSVGISASITANKMSCQAKSTTYSLKPFIVFKTFSYTVCIFSEIVTLQQS
jgi:hypothetical protein